jgi:hypothetical protein
MKRARGGRRMLHVSKMTWLTSDIQHSAAIFTLRS